jgi:pimeloyl-ACP methyl ester carboxylesterase
MGEPHLIGSRKWISRSLLFVLAVVVLGIAALYVRFLIWRHSVIAELATHSTVVMTKRGPVEYASYGQGPPVLIVHGSPGGYDQIYDLLRITIPHPAQRFIIPSRPGYLRTPLWVGRTPEQQADAFAALLDAIHVDRVAVIGGSGGGPSALRFALQYPDRCNALVLESAVTRAWQAAPPPGGIAGLASTAFDTEFGRWLLTGLIVRSVLGSHASDPLMSSELRSAIRTTYPFALRQAGYDNDVQQYRSLPDWPLERIRCPTLIIHGNADTTVPYAHAEFAHRIPGSRLVTIAGGNHFAGITNPGEIAAAEASFLPGHLAK